MNKLAITGFAMTLMLGAANAGAQVSKQVAEPTRPAMKKTFVLGIPAPEVMKACHYSNSGYVYWISSGGGTCSSSGGDGTCSDAAGNMWTEENPC